VLDGRAPALGPGDLPAGSVPGRTVALLDASRRLLAVARLVAPNARVELLRVFREP
jgi:hypothetical protein